MGRRSDLRSERSTGPLAQIPSGAASVASMAVGHLDFPSA